MSDSRISRREVILMGSAAGALCLGGVADEVINGSAFGSSAGLNAAADRLQNIPSSFGNWNSREREIPEREQRVAGIHGYIRRDCHNDATGHRVHLTILCGPSGPMSVHPPTACFQGSGFSLASGPVVTSFDLAAAAVACEFNKSTFQRKLTRVPLRVRVFWGWGTAGDWSAPKYPRVAFRSHSWLYKLYVTDRRQTPLGQPVVPQAEGFLADALPVIRKALSIAPANARAIAFPSPPRETVESIVGCAGGEGFRRAGAGERNARRLTGDRG